MTSRFPWKTSASNLAVISETNLCFDDQVRKLYRWNLLILGRSSKGDSCFYICLFTFFTSESMSGHCRRGRWICRRDIILTLLSVDWLLVNFKAALLRKTTTLVCWLIESQSCDFLLSPQNVWVGIHSIQGYKKQPFWDLIDHFHGSCLAAAYFSSHLGLRFASEEISKDWKCLRRRINIPDEAA